MRTRAALAALCLFAAPAYAEDEPLRSPLRESVSVERSALEITAWPVSGELAMCAELDLDGIEIFHRGAWRTRRSDSSVTIDRLGYVERSVSAAAGEPRAEPQWIVVYVDETHFPPCDVPPEASMRWRAFEQTRAMIATEFDPVRGDRVMLASYMGGEVPHIATGWLDSREAALSALDRLWDESARPPRLRVTDNAMHDWFGALAQLVHAIGDPEETAATKHVILLAADLPIDARWAEELATLNREALSVSRTLVHTVDVRSRFAGQEYGLGSLAWNAGGHFFANGATVTSAVATLKELSHHGCKLLVTVPRTAIETVRVDLRDARFRAESLIAKGLPASQDVERRRREARSLRPQWGEGVAIEAALWPIEDAGDHLRGVLFARVMVDPRGPASLRLEAAVSGASLVERGPAQGGESAVTSIEVAISGADLASLRETGSRTFVFEVRAPRGVRPAYRIVVESEDGRHGASTQSMADIAMRPSWALIEHVGPPGAALDLLPLIGEGVHRVIPIPALDGAIPQNWSANFVGRTCSKGRSMTATLASGDGRRVPVEVVPVSSSVGGCAWYLAKSEPLSPGTWVFRPPRGFDGRPVTFHVTPAQEPTQSAARTTGPGST